MINNKIKQPNNCISSKRTLTIKDQKNLLRKVKSPKDKFLRRGQLIECKQQNKKFRKKSYKSQNYQTSSNIHSKQLTFKPYNQQKKNSRKKSDSKFQWTLKNSSKKKKNKEKQRALKKNFSKLKSHISSKASSQHLSHKSKKTKKSKSRVNEVHFQLPNRQYYGNQSKKQFQNNHKHDFLIAAANTQQTFSAHENNFLHKYSKIMKKIKSLQQLHSKEFQIYRKHTKQNELMRLVKMHSLERINLESRLSKLTLDYP